MSEQLEIPFEELSLGTMVDKACKILRAYEPHDRPYWGCFSGGKDSVVIKELARRAGVRVNWVYNVTTIDPPELVRFIRQHHKDVRFDHPGINFFAEMQHRKIIPTRVARWCCDVAADMEAAR